MSVSPAAKVTSLATAGLGFTQIVGWGTTSESGSSSNQLRTATVPTVSDSSCKSSYGSDYVASRNSRSSRSGDSRSRREGESSRGRSENPVESSNKSPSNTSTSSADQAEILKRLMERREKESQ